MPRNTREALLRKADQVLNDLDRALEKLQILSATYEPTHKDHSKLVDLFAAQVMNVKEQVTDFKNKFM